MGEEPPHPKSPVHQTRSLERHGPPERSWEATVDPGQQAQDRGANHGKLTASLFPYSDRPFASLRDRQIRQDLLFLDPWAGPPIAREREARGEPSLTQSPPVQ